MNIALALFPLQSAQEHYWAIELTHERYDGASMATEGLGPADDGIDGARKNGIVRRPSGAGPSASNFLRAR